MGFSLRLQRFCCCCTLRTGSLVIGTVGWLFTVLEIFYLLGPVTNPNASIEDEYFAAIHKRSIFTEIGYGVVTLIVCVLLIFGVYKRDKRYMLPWLVLKCFEVIILVLGTGIFFVAACLTDGDDESSEKGLLFGFTGFLAVSTVISWYCWLCVYSHYRLTGEGVSQDGIPPVYFTPTSAPPPTYQDAEKSKFGLT